MSAPETEEAPARWIDRPGVRNFLGRYLIGGYIRFVRMTSRVVAEPSDFWESAHKDWPAIAVSWHGQSNLAYVVMPDPRQVALLISMHPDGQMMGDPFDDARAFVLHRGQGHQRSMRTLVFGQRHPVYPVSRMTSRLA